MRAATRFFVSLVCGAALCGCAKKTAVAGTSTPSAAQSSATKVNPVIQKYHAVFNSMPERFRSEIYIPDSEVPAFAAQLDALLASDSEDLLRYVAKNCYLPADYEPEDLVPVKANQNYTVSRNDLSLRKTVFDALNEMGAAAKQDGITLMVSSTYRSYTYQKWLFQHWVDVDGLEEAERESARAGSSQHQLGVAVDFGSITDDFALTKECHWLDDHAMEYGWSLSFPKEYEDVSGFRWECWHFRYIGKEACDMQKKYFRNVQHYMIEFMHNWKNYSTQ